VGRFTTHKAFAAGTRSDAEGCGRHHHLALQHVVAAV
jgi:hypothetical protein